MPDASPCVDDETLFAFARGQLAATELQHVEAHLKDCADCRAVLAEAARSLESGTLEAAGSDGGGPSSIARYQIMTLLGAGAAGVVYRAFDPQLKRAVALKLLRPELHGTSPEQSERMLREAQAMARLSDPHVVAVYDVGLHEGSVYLVMEFIDGHTLSAWLSAQPRSRAEILKVFADAGRGLAAAHEKGLVHRDFKPENVLVARDGRAKVTDFGLARESESWLAERQVDDQASTELYAPTRGLVGTPAYMAPELFEGGRASPASDQFAFCVALFVALFEQHPFKAGEGIALSELMTRVCAGALQKPSLANAGSERLFEVLRRGFAVAPSARFGNLAQLLAALERASGKRRGGVFVGLAIVGLLLAALAATRFGGHAGAILPAKPAASAAAGSAAAPAGSNPARPGGDLATTSDSATRTPTPAASVPAASASEKRRPPKPTDVRYKDWLKDPF
ncbi:MAG TPA: protein kinase [Polyangiaceae bacterium]|nr:protein kinase [Polyangiaceae bacterium]